MEQIILIFHVLIALAIIGLIMLQQGKGADMGASFGSGASQTLFGSAGGGNALTKATALLVALFFVTSFGLAFLAKGDAIGAGDIDIPAVQEDAVDDADIPVDELEGSPSIDSDMPTMPESEGPAASEN